jgi:hypothetical protein
MDIRRLASSLPLAALARLAAWPLLRYGPPSVIDGPLHFCRLVELEWHVRHGDLYPRWFADLHYGFGAPVLNFYAPLSYYLLLGLRLLGLSFPAAYLAGFALAVVAAIGGMYFWARDEFDSPLAGLTAAAYGLSPYFYFNVLERGAYPETWGLALAPKGAARQMARPCTPLICRPPARTTRPTSGRGTSWCATPSASSCLPARRASRWPSPAWMGSR